MLKIKDNVDLKKFKYYGYKILYSREDGEPEEIYKEYIGNLYWLGFFQGYKPKIKITFRREYKWRTKKKIWVCRMSSINKAHGLDDVVEDIYRMTKADLVEKVGDNND